MPPILIFSTLIMVSTPICDLPIHYVKQYILITTVVGESIKSLGAWDMCFL